MAIFSYNDGGRSDAGYKGDTGDCVTRAIAIASGVPYSEVREELMTRTKSFRETSRTKRAKRLKGNSVFHGALKDVYEPYLEELGFQWTPTCKFGSPDRVHLRKEELPDGVIICKVSRHLCTVIDGIIQDVYDPSRKGDRMVYGYYSR